MSALLGHFRQQPREDLGYTVDYGPWLAAGEFVTTIVAEIDNVTDPMLVVSAPTGTPAGADFTGVQFNVSGGLSGEQYKVTLLVDTTTGQKVEREILYSIEEV